MPWVHNLPVQLIVTVFFVTPPLVIFGWPTLTGDELFTDSHMSKQVVSVCVAFHMFYVVLRAIASACSWFEIIVLSIMVLWVILLFIKREMVTHKLYEEVVAVLCGGMLLMYAMHLMTIGSELRRISRQLVSKKKRRYVDTHRGFDLDLSYISRRIIAMGFPSQSTLETQFRNPMSEVQRLLDTQHKGHYKVYNLCIERTYHQKCFEREFHEVRFPDHNPCSLAKLLIICSDMQAFAAASRLLNVVVVHCKAGKGRTGLVISAFLLHTRKASSAKEALELFGQQRTHNGKGVTIPSQIRYVYHYEKVVREGGLRRPVWLKLLRLTATPEVAEVQTWRFQIMTHEDGNIFDSEREKEPPLLEGDVKFAVFHQGTKLFHFWFHTAYDPILSMAAQPPKGAAIWESQFSPLAGTPDWTIMLPRLQLDGAHKDKGDAQHTKVPLGLQIIATFSRPSWNEEHEQKIVRERRWAQREREKRISLHLNALAVDGQRRKSKSIDNPTLHREVSDVTDYDHLDNETDEEELMSTLHRGYLFRSPGRCRKRIKRWCEISTLGCLHIMGRELLHVNVARDAEKVFQPVDGAPAWKVRNNIKGHWELLEAEPEEVKHWDQAFADSLRLSAASHDPETAFCGFFWKSNRDADDMKMQEAFDFADWRVRLFVLRKNGQVITFSWKEQNEVVFLDVSQPGSMLERAPFRWRSMPKTVPFQVFSKGEKPRTLAAREEDFNAFINCVSQIRRLSAPTGNLGQQVTKW